VYDPDAPTGSGWWHWIVFDLPAEVSALPRGIGRVAKLPAGARQGRNDFGTGEFGGACPPAGDKPHRYIFTIYALKVDHLELPPDASAALIGFKINANQIGKASITRALRPITAPTVTGEGSNPRERQRPEGGADRGHRVHAVHQPAAAGQQRDGRQRDRDLHRGGGQRPAV